MNLINWFASFFIGAAGTGAQDTVQDMELIERMSVAESIIDRIKEQHDDAKTTNRQRKIASGYLIEKSNEPYRIATYKFCLDKKTKDETKCYKDVDNETHYLVTVAENGLNIENNVILNVMAKSESTNLGIVMDGDMLLSGVEGYPPKEIPDTIVEDIDIANGDIVLISQISSQYIQSLLNLLNKKCEKGFEYVCSDDGLDCYCAASVEQLGADALTDEQALAYIKPDIQCPGEQIFNEAQFACIPDPNVNKNCDPEKGEIQTWDPEKLVWFCDKSKDQQEIWVCGDGSDSDYDDNIDGNNDSDDCYLAVCNEANISDCCNKPHEIFIYDSSRSGSNKYTCRPNYSNMNCGNCRTGKWNYADRMWNCEIDTGVNDYKNFRCDCGYKDVEETNDGKCEYSCKSLESTKNTSQECGWLPNGEECPPDLLVWDGIDEDDDDSDGTDTDWYCDTSSLDDCDSPYYIRNKDAVETELFEVSYLDDNGDIIPSATGSSATDDLIWSDYVIDDPNNGLVCAKSRPYDCEICTNGSQSCQESAYKRKWIEPIIPEPEGGQEEVGWSGCYRPNIIEVQRGCPRVWDDIDGWEYDTCTSPGCDEGELITWQEGTYDYNCLEPFCDEGEGFTEVLDQWVEEEGITVIPTETCLTTEEQGQINDGVLTKNLNGENKDVGVCLNSSSEDATWNDEWCRFECQRIVKPDHCYLKGRTDNFTWDQNNCAWESSEVIDIKDVCFNVIKEKYHSGESDFDQLYGYCTSYVTTLPHETEYTKETHDDVEYLFIKKNKYNSREDNWIEDDCTWNCSLIPSRDNKGNSDQHIPNEDTNCVRNIWVDTPRDNPRPGIIPYVCHWKDEAYGTWADPLLVDARLCERFISADQEKRSGQGEPCISFGGQAPIGFPNECFRYCNFDYQCMITFGFDENDFRELLGGNPDSMDYERLIEEQL